MERRIEGTSLGRMPEAVHHKPSGLLRNFEVFRQRGRGDPLRVVRHEPNSHEPLAQRQLRVFEDRSDLDRKPLAAGPALERLAVGEMIDPIIAAVGAKLPVAPTQFAKMVEARLLVREGREQVEKAVDVGDHESSPSLETNLSPNQIWVKLVYRSHRKPLAANTRIWINYPRI